MSSYRHALLFLILTGFSLTAGAQSQRLSTFQRAQELFQQGRFPDAIVEGKRAIELQTSPSDSLEKVQQIDTWELVGRAYEKLSELDSAEAYRKVILQLKGALYSENSLEFASYLDNCAGFYAGRSCRQTSLDLRFRALGILEHHPDQGKPQVRDLTAKVCNNLAALLEGKGEMDLARKYLDKALALLSPEATPYLRSIILLQNASFLAKAGKSVQALEQLEQVERFLPDEPRPQAYYWDVRAEQYRQINRPDSALYCHLKRLQSLQRLPVGPTDVAHTHLNISFDYMQMKEWSASIRHLDTSIAIEQKIYGDQFAMLYVAYRHKGQCLMALGDTVAAHDYFLKALKANNYDGCSIQNMRDPGQGFCAFAVLADYYRGQSNDLQALKYYQKADSSLILQRKLLQEPGSKINLSAQSKATYENAIATAYALYQQTQDPLIAEWAFYFSERNKGLILQEAFMASNARTVGGVPDSLYLPVIDLRQNIATLENQRWLTMDKLRENNITDFPEAHPEVLALSEKMVDQKARLGVLEAFLETNYDQYKHLKTDFSPISRRMLLDSVLLPSGKSLLEYFVAENGVYAFKITSRGFSFTFEPIAKDTLRRWVALARRGILGSDQEQQPNPGQQQFFREYLQYGYQLYQKLVAPLIPASDTTSWVIVPDDCLWQVPFDALLTKVPGAGLNFKNLPYLTWQLVISYAASATSLDFMSKKRHNRKTSIDFLGFAPFYEKSMVELGKIFPKNRLMGDKFDPLDQSGRPVAAGRVVFPNNRTYVFGQATKQQFKDAISQCRILEVFSHAVADRANSERACLIFRKQMGGKLVEDSLFVSEIYSLDINADVALILGCGTGDGKVQTGEGSMSLAYAFAFAGAKSVMATHWSVQEGPAADLVTGFFREASQGEKTDIALATSKRAFLRSADNYWCLPYFWAGLYLFGDTRGLLVPR